MPWQERSIVTVRNEFVTNATQEGAINRKRQQS
ncbi:hypothetical protein BH24CHL3_BH24CHL3_11390 [soil metagenome]